MTKNQAMRELAAFALFCFSIFVCCLAFGERAGWLFGGGLIYMKASNRGPFKML